MKVTKRTWLIGLFLFCATFVVFSRVLVADFVHWDDDISVYENPHVQGLDWERLRWMFTDASYALRYKPLTWLSYAIIYHFSGLNPFWYHLVNLLLHSMNAALAFVVIRRLLAVSGSAGSFGDARANVTLPAAFGALLWAVNPLRAEPVARVTDLTYCLLLSFLMLSLWCYLRAQQENNVARRHIFYWCSVLAFVLSMFSYPFAFGYGVVLIALDWYPLRRLEGGVLFWQNPAARKVWLEKLPFLLAGGLILTTFHARTHPTGIWAGQSVNSNFDLVGQGMQAFYVWAYYVWKTWIPFHLSPLYTNLVQFDPDTWPFWLSAAFVIGVTWLVIQRRHQWPWALTLWVSHLVLLLPALGLTEKPHFTSDRYSYLPGLVWAVVLAAVLSKGSFRPRTRTAGFLLALAMIIWWTTLSWGQVRIWRNSVTLFEHMIRELGDHPYRGDIHWRLGWFYANHGQFDKAVREHQTAIQIRPAEGPYLALAGLLRRHGQPEAALTNYLAVLRFSPNPYTFVKVGETFAELGRNDEAIAQYRAALYLSPNLVPALTNLAWSLATDPDLKDRNGKEAVQLAEKAAVLTGRQSPSVMSLLASVYVEIGRFEEAVAAAKSALSLAQASGDRESVEKISRLLERYQAGKPSQETPKSIPGKAVKESP